MSVYENMKAFKPPKAEDIVFPSDVADQDKARAVLTDLFTLATDVVTSPSETLLSRRKKFEHRVNEYLDQDPAASRFLLSNHPSYGVNWLGYVRHLFGRPVAGRAELPPRTQPRGVGSRSGKSRTW